MALRVWCSLGRLPVEGSGLAGRWFAYKADEGVARHFGSMERKEKRQELCVRNVGLKSNFPIHN